MTAQVMIEDLAVSYCNSHPDAEFCEDCFAVFIWDKIPDENIKTEQQGHPYGSTTAYETIVVGWTCPACDHYNSL